MNLKLALIGLLSSASTAYAFSPIGKNPLHNQVMQARENVASSPLWRPPMNMVAGGAEKAYGQEYYEGACERLIVRLLHYKERDAAF
jgi:hypothetical protein